MKEPISIRQWILISLTIYGVMLGAFLASEFFKDVDAVMYPATFFLLAFAIIGPGIIAGVMPLRFVQRHPTAALVIRVSIYPACLLSLRLLYSALHGMGIL
ncbi:MAG: hypothetical protein J6S92_02980 [Oscillospiraceae bacterium]|nr:hypothetical protein [Oscillospiraceae bacterium]